MSQPRSTVTDVPSGPSPDQRGSRALRIPQIMRSIVARTPDECAPSGRVVALRIVLLAVGMRVMLEVVGLLARWLSGRPDPLGDALSMWSAWDAPHYLDIATHGYRTSGESALFVVFFPLYPLAVRLASIVFRDVILSGLAVSFVGQVAAGWLLYKLVRLDADHPTAWRTVLLLFSFPAAYFLAAPYTESMFLAATLGAVYAARTSRWGRAGLGGAIATGTRVSGVAILPALAWEALRPPASVATRSKRLALAGTASGGLALYLGLNKFVYGDALHFLDVQRSHWYQRPVPPWTTLTESVGKLATGGLREPFMIIHIGRLAGTALAVALLLAGIRHLRVADQLYGWASLVLILSAYWLISLPRYLLGIYPLFVVAGHLTRRRVVLWTVLATGVCLQAFLFARFATRLWTF